jgi:hypothetical protein
MFPISFAFDVVNRYTDPGDAVLDPFAGRASSIYAAAASGRSGAGIEINPVGWLYGHVKLSPACEPNVLRRLEEIGRTAHSADVHFGGDTEEFFTLCYSRAVLDFLATCRASLRWRDSIVDATLMAIILIYLHGKRSASLSNQMRQGKAMSPDYSVGWWRERELTPPEVDPVAFMRQRIEWRYAKGRPKLSEAKVLLGDSRQRVPRLGRDRASNRRRGFDLLFTSPPYSGVTNYHADQWLRLWMLGGEPSPASGEGFSRGRFYAGDHYAELLRDVFGACAQVMKTSATVYVRTDARRFTFETTLQVLRETFPRKRLRLYDKPFMGSTQTAQFGDHAPKPGEVDIVMK